MNDSNVTKFQTSTDKARGRYHNMINLLRKVGRGNLTRDEQEDVAHTLNYIESYGFGFVPNHYVMDEVVKLERFAKEKLNEL